MSHNIWERDTVLLFKKPAWHKIGIVVDKAPSPREALIVAKQDWEIEQIALFGERKQTVMDENGVREVTSRLNVPGHVANVRSDTGEVLAVVGAGFGVVQNRELVELIYGAAQSEDVTVESAGSLRNGREVFWLCHLDTFALAGMDRVHQYALIVNAHDGSSRLKAVPTDVRVVCANTKTWALSTAKAAGLGIALRHSSGIMDRMPEVRDALRGVKAKAKKAREGSVALSRRTMTREEVETFFMGVYVNLYGAPPTGATHTLSRGAKGKRTRCLDMVTDWSHSLGSEAADLGIAPTAWLAANAVTQWADHRRTARGERIHSNLIGSAAAAKDVAFASALALV